MSLALEKNTVTHDGAKQKAGQFRLGLYRTLWRWHFYAGLFCIPFILSLSITGAIFLFKPQIDAWSDRAENTLTPHSTTMSANEHILAAQAALPNAQFLSYRLPQTAQHAAVITLKQEGKKYAVYIHPNTASVLKVVNQERTLLYFVRTFHGELLAGNTGSVLVELASCWAIVLILTGLYLWWPRNANGIAGVLYPRINKGTRTLLRDLHAVIGFWISFFTLFLLISGLPWALVWGSAFKEVRTWATSPPSAHHHNQAPSTQSTPPDWTLSRAQERPSWKAQAVNTANLPRAVIDTAQTLSFAPPVELSVANAETNQWKVASQHQNRPLRSTAWLTPTGEIIKHQTFQQKSSVDKAIGIGIAAHEGQLFGWFNQLLGLLTALGLITLSITGFLMWRRRKPSASLGAPPIFAKGNTATVVFIGMLVLAALLPLLAASMITLLVLEKSVLRFFPNTREWLGIH